MSEEPGNKSGDWIAVTVVSVVYQNRVEGFSLPLATTKVWQSFWHFFLYSELDCLSVFWDICILISKHVCFDLSAVCFMIRLLRVVALMPFIRHICIILNYMNWGVFSFAYKFPLSDGSVLFNPCS